MRHLWPFCYSTLRLPNKLSLFFYERLFMASIAILSSQYFVFRHLKTKSLENSKWPWPIHLTSKPKNKGTFFFNSIQKKALCFLQLWKLKKKRPFFGLGVIWGIYGLFVIQPWDTKRQNLLKTQNGHNSHLTSKPKIIKALIFVQF